MNSSSPTSIEQYQHCQWLPWLQPKEKVGGFFSVHPPNWKCLRWSSIKARLPGYVCLPHPWRDGQGGGRVGTGSCNGGNRRGVWWTSASTSTKLPLWKVWRPSLDVPHLSADRRHRHWTGNTGTKIQGTGRFHSVHTPRTSSCIRALTVATRLAAVHSHQPWWSFVTGCSSREPLGSMEYDVRRSKSTCQRDQNLSNPSRHPPDLHE